MKTELRLQVFLAHAGIASRRSSEDLIREGRVSINKTIVTELGSKVSVGEDHVYLDGKEVVLESQMHYLALNKPQGYICAASDPKGRQLAISLFKNTIRERIYNIGRLDQWSSGLILFTNDGDFAATISHPSSQIEKEYHIECSTVIPDAFFTEFRRGITVEGIFYQAVFTKRLSDYKATLVLIEGKNREIRRVLAHFNLGIKTLERVRIGPVKIGGLAEGEFRKLNDQEISVLRQN